MKIMSVNSTNFSVGKTSVQNTRKSNFTNCCDTVSFKSKNLSDDEKCVLLLNEDNRFSPFEKGLIKEKLSNFKTILPKSKVLTKILSISNSNNEDKDLDTLNIVNYLNTTSGYYAKEQMAILDIIDYKFNYKNKNNDEIRESVFSPMKYTENAILDIAKAFQIDDDGYDSNLKNKRILAKTFDIVNNVYKQGINLYPCVPNISFRLAHFPNDKYDDALEKAIIQKTYASHDIRDIRNCIDNITTAECRKYIK